MKGSLFGPGTIVLGGGAVLLILVLLIGFFLPTEWSVSAEVRIEVSSDELMPYLDSPEGWARWTAWPDSGLTRSGPGRGAGASISWQDQELGAGSFTIGEVAETSVLYDVEVDWAANTLMITNGEIDLEPLGSATLMRWTESGDLGRNPLMGFWGLTMERAQARELQKSLDQLAELVVRSDSVPIR